MTNLELYRPSPVLLRHAVAMCRKAAMKEIESKTSVEAAARMHDSVISTIILGHAAMESELSWLVVEAQVKKRHWPTEILESINDIAAVKGRPIVTQFPPNFLGRFEIIGAWRNFLQHRDEKSLGNLTSKIPIVQYEDLSPELAREVIEVTDIFFDFISTTTGSQLIGPSNLLWVSPTELL